LNDATLFEHLEADGSKWRTPKWDWYWITTAQKFKPPFKAIFKIHALRSPNNFWRAAVGVSKSQYTASENWWELINPSYSYGLWGKRMHDNIHGYSYGVPWKEGDITMIVDAQGNIQFVVNGQNQGTAYTVNCEVYIMIAMAVYGKIELLSVESN